jgi:hypothetical protein
MAPPDRFFTIPYIEPEERTGEVKYYLDQYVQNTLRFINAYKNVALPDKFDIEIENGGNKTIAKNTSIVRHYPLATENYPMMRTEMILTIDITWKKSPRVISPHRAEFNPIFYGVIEHGTPVTTATRLISFSQTYGGKIFYHSQRSEGFAISNAETLATHGWQGGRAFFEIQFPVGSFTSTASMKESHATASKKFSEILAISNQLSDILKRGVR